MTPTRRLLDLNLDGSLDAIVTERRTDGESWQSIARHLTVLTGITITDESLRRWYGTES